MEEERPTTARKMPNILVTGTPGTGKTTHCRLLVEYIPDLIYISVGELVNEKKLYTKWNEAFDCPEFDDDMVVDALEYIHEQGGHVIEFHTSSVFPERWFDLVVLLRAGNTELYDRLKARDYAEKKITENIECEIFEVTADEAKESYKPEVIMELQSNKAEDVENNINSIIEWAKQWAAQRKQQ